MMRTPALVRVLPKRALWAVAIGVLGALPLPSAQAQAFPPTWQVGNETLQLNGSGRRLFSFLKLGIYDASLYLPSKETDAAKVLSSQGPKVMAVRMLRSGGSKPIREGWEESFKANCVGACIYPAAEVQRFLGAVPAAEEGAEKIFVFQRNGVVDITHQGKPWMSFSSPEFSRLLLATWLGPAPPTPELKAALLGQAAN